MTESAEQPKPPRPRVDGEERKRQLVTACAELIATKGYSHTSVRDIARHVGISTGTLLHHFPTKEDLLVGTLTYVGSDFLMHMEESLDGVASAPEKLRRFARAVLDSPRHDVGWRVWIAFWHEASINPEIAPAAYNQSMVTEELLTSVIVAGCESGELNCKEPEMNAVEFLVLIEGCAVRLFGEPGRLSVERAIAMVDQLVDDWSANHAPRGCPGSRGSLSGGSLVPSVAVGSVSSE